MSILTSKADKIGCLNEISKIGIDKFREKCWKAGLNFWEKM
jgi:hypothetical protein